MGIGSVAGADIIALAGITDLEIIENDGSLVLVSVTRGGGAIAAYDIAGPSTLIDTWELTLGTLAAEPPDIEFFSAGWGDVIVAPGLLGSTLLGVTTTGVADSSYLGSRRSVSVTGAEASDLGDLVMFGAGSHGIAALTTGGLALVDATLSRTLTLSPFTALAGLADVRATALQTATFGNVQITVAAFGSADALAVIRADPSGQILGFETYTASTEQGWFHTPSALVLTALAGENYVVMSASGTSSLTVFAVAADGTLRTTDHVIDSTGTAFAHATTLELVTLEDRRFLIVAGSDPGFSVLELLPGGRLQLIDSVFTSDQMPLSGITDIEAIGADGALRLWLSQQSAPYLSEFRIDLVNRGTTLVAAPTGSTLTGGTGDDNLAGGAGNDVLAGGQGADVIVDGAGSDTLSGAQGADIFVLVADGATDVITDFNAAEDRLDLTSFGTIALATTLQVYLRPYGLELRVGGEVLELHAAPGTTLTGASLTSGSFTGLDRPIAYGGTDFEALLAAVGPESGIFYGSSLADSMPGGAGDDELWGYGGNDTLNGGAGADRMIGGNGDDLYVVDSPSDVVVETADGGIDRVASSISIDLLGRAGAHANVENVSLYGTATLCYGSNGNNRIWGNAQANALAGRGGNDFLSAGNGDDTLNGGTGADRMIGGTGNDLYYVDNVADVVVETVGGGVDRVASWISIDLLGRAGAYANVENVVLHGSATQGYGSHQNNRIWGNALANTLAGRSGNDLLSGGNGHDTLYGGAGADTLYGGTGTDRLSGGPRDAARDVFVFRNPSDSRPSALRDVITDFEAGVDIVNLTAIDANTLTSGDQAFRLSAAGAASHSLWYSTDSLGLTLYGDINGDTVADFEIRCLGLTELDAGSLLL